MIPIPTTPYHFCFLFWPILWFSLSFLASRESSSIWTCVCWGGFPGIVLDVILWRVWGSSALCILAFLLTSPPHRNHKTGFQATTWLHYCIVIVYLCSSWWIFFLSIIAEVKFWLHTRPRSWILLIEGLALHVFLLNLFLKNIWALFRNTKLILSRASLCSQTSHNSSSMLRWLHRAIPENICCTASHRCPFRFRSGYWEGDWRTLNSLSCLQNQFEITFALGASSVG